MTNRTWRGWLILLPLSFAMACGTSATIGDGGPPPTNDASTSDVSPVPSSSSTTIDAGGIDAGCTGTCRSMALDGVYGPKTAKFERAQFGWDKKGPTVVGITTEIHAGGSPACPTQSSPTPDRTLVVSGITVGSEGRTLTLADGIAVTLLDFKEALTKKPLDKATQVKLTVIAMEGTPPENVAFDLEATFEEGTIKGHVFAQHCTTMD